MALSTLLSDSKLAIQMAPLILFAPGSIATLLVSFSFGNWFITGSPFILGWVFKLLYFLPQMPFAVLMSEYFRPHSAEDVLGVTLAGAWVAAILVPIGYFLLYFYLDAIIPNAYGIT